MKMSHDLKHQDFDINIESVLDSTDTHQDINDGDSTDKKIE